MLSFRQLKHGRTLSKTKMETIARLIYETDKYIYLDMFGRVENAIAVLPKLFESGKDQMFTLDNLFVCVLAGQVVGIILWHEGALDWNNEHLKKMLQNEKLEFDEEKALKIMKAKSVCVFVDMHEGDASATAWGCDLTHEYVTINADYRS